MRFLRGRPGGGRGPGGPPYNRCQASDCGKVCGVSCPPPIDLSLARCAFHRLARRCLYCLIISRAPRLKDMIVFLVVVLLTAIDIGAGVLGRIELGYTARIAVALAPLPADIALIVLVLRRIRRLDEFQKRVHFEAVTVAFLSTGVAVFVYGYLQRAHAAGRLMRDWSGRLFYASLLRHRLFHCREPLPMKNRMRVLRAENEGTQAQLAAMIGVSRRAIVAVENASTSRRSLWPSGLRMPLERTRGKFSFGRTKTVRLTLHLRLTL
jgi:hypothetical protein